MNPIKAELSESSVNEISVRSHAARSLVDLAEAYDVTDSTMLQLAADQLREVVATKKQLCEMRIELKKPFLDGGREIDLFFKVPIEFCDKAERILKIKYLDFTAAQERARKAAEQEQKRLAQIEQNRIEAEQRAQAQALREHAEKASAEEKAILQEQAREVESAPVIIPFTAPDKISETRVSGISSRSTWKAELVDLKLFIQAALHDPELLSMIKIDGAALNARARSARSALSIPGVAVYEDKSLAVR